MLISKCRGWQRQRLARRTLHGWLGPFRGLSNVRSGRSRAIAKSLHAAAAPSATSQRFLCPSILDVCFHRLCSPLQPASEPPRSNFCTCSRKPVYSCTLPRHPRRATSRERDDMSKPWDFARQSSIEPVQLSSESLQKASKAPRHGEDADKQGVENPPVDMTLEAHRNATLATSTY